MAARRILVMLCTLVPLALPATASATFSQETSAGDLQVDGSSAGNTVTVVLNGDKFEITDTTDDMGVDNDHCTKPTATSHTALCDASPVATFTAKLGKGDDKLTTSAPIAMHVEGGEGTDDLSGGTAGDTLIGGPGDDTVHGGPGDDMLVAESMPDDLSQGQNTMDGGEGHDDVFGGGGPDVVMGGPGDDGVAGAGGDDMVDGQDGNDSVLGGPGKDMLFGSAGNDYLYPGDGPAGGTGDDDAMSGGDGIDEATYATRTTGVVVSLNGQADDGFPGENDNVLGDVEKVTGGMGDDRISGGAAPETLNGGPGADLIGGGGGADDLEGGNGDDTFDGGPGADLIAGGAGVDGARYLASGFQPITVALDAQAGDGASGEGDNVQPDVENLATGGGADTLTGSDAGNAMDSGDGEDYTDGGAGPDDLRMGAARDVVRARDGVADTVDCGSSSDFAIVDPVDVVAKSCERLDKGRTKARFGRVLQLRPLKGGEAFGLKGMHRTVPLRDAIGVPLGGTKLDATTGTVRLTAARGSGGRTFSGDFSEGAFRVKQAHSEGGLTELSLTGGASLSTCPKAKAGGARAAASHRVLRRLFGHAHGRFRTRGRNSTATVRGTQWSVIDRCDGTLTKVKDGTVRVRDLRKKRTVTLKSGQSYLARRGNR